MRTGMTTVGMPGSPKGIQPVGSDTRGVTQATGLHDVPVGKNRLGDRNEFLPTVHGFDEFYGKDADAWDAKVKLAKRQGEVAQLDAGRQRRSSPRRANLVLPKSCRSGEICCQKRQRKTTKKPRLQGIS